MEKTQEFTTEFFERLNKFLEDYAPDELKKATAEMREDFERCDEERLLSDEDIHENFACSISEALPLEAFAEWKIKREGIEQETEPEEDTRRRDYEIECM